MRVLGYEIVSGEQYDALVDKATKANEFGDTIFKLRRKADVAKSDTFRKSEKILELQKGKEELSKEIDAQIEYSRELESTLTKLKEVAKPKKVVKRKVKAKK